MVMVVVIVIQVLVVRFFGLCLVQLMTARHLRLFSAIGQEFWLLSHTKNLVMRQVRGVVISSR